MIEKIQQQLQAHTWEPTLIVAVSGGVDSVVLLHALRQHLPTAKLVVAHVNYHLRAESDADAAFVAAKAEGFDLLNTEVQHLPFWEKGIKFFNLQGPDGVIVEFCEIVK